jgi:hypothetical protein
MEQLISYKRAKYARLPISDGRFPVRPGLPVMVLQVPRKERLIHWCRQTSEINCRV